MDASFFTILQATFLLIAVIRVIECLVLVSSDIEHPVTKLNSLIMMTVSIVLLLLSKLLEELCSSTVLAQKISVNFVLN
jgi:hypothetical protein